MLVLVCVFVKVLCGHNKGSRYEVNSQTCVSDSCYIKYTICRASHTTSNTYTSSKKLVSISWPFHPPFPSPIPILSGHWRTRPIDKSKDFWSPGKKHQNHSCYAPRKRAGKGWRESKAPGWQLHHLFQNDPQRSNVEEMKEMESHFINLRLCIHRDENCRNIKEETHDARSWDLDTFPEM